MLLQATQRPSITIPVKDVSNMLGKDYVFFTYIYELKSDGTPNYDNLLVSHTDMNDSQKQSASRTSQQNLLIHNRTA